MSVAEIAAYLSGDTDFWFGSKELRDALTTNGTANWLLYRGGAWFVHYLHVAKPENFDKRIALGNRT